MRQIKSRTRTRNLKRKRSSSSDEAPPSKQRKQITSSNDKLSSETKKALRSLLKPKINSQILTSSSFSDQLIKFSAKTSSEYKVAVPSFIGKRQANLRGRRLHVDEPLLVIQETNFKDYTNNKEELEFLKSSESSLPEEGKNSKKINANGIGARKTRSSQKEYSKSISSPDSLQNNKHRDIGRDTSVTIDTPTFRICELKSSSKLTTKTTTSEESTTPNQFTQPPSYIRFQDKTDEEIYQQDEYDLDENDEQWIKNNLITLKQSLKRQQQHCNGAFEGSENQNPNPKVISKPIRTRSHNRIRKRTRIRTRKSKSKNNQSFSIMGENNSEIFDKFEQVIDKLEKEYHPNLIDDTKDTAELIESEGSLGSSTHVEPKHCMENVIEYFAWMGEEENDNAALTRSFIVHVYQYWLQKKENTGMLPLIQRMRQFKIYLVRTKRRGTTQRRSRKNQTDITSMKPKEVVEEYEKLEELRQQLELIRLLSDMVKRREKLKKANTKVRMEILQRAFGTE
eukprot:gb/GECH01006262.1/.p1 GENE.gb/GECH01006262.1/~~gb/GECH01006262.1/.p1  ORF type:complete len:510 (+),score=121.51 gb/GECH01006262.1/:1-1530(+)